MNKKQALDFIKSLLINPEYIKILRVENDEYRTRIDIENASIGSFCLDTDKIDRITWLQIVTTTYNTHQHIEFTAKDSKKYALHLHGSFKQIERV